MRTHFLLAAALPVLLAAPAAFAQEKAAYAIANGAYADAERTLVADLRKSPDRAETQLNLAAVYVLTGREAQARALYAQVLAQPDVMMDVGADRVVGSHKVATNGLRRLQGTQLSSR